MSKETKKVVGYECKFNVYCPPTEVGGSDYHFVKEVLHYEDGTTAPNTRVLKDFKRPFWITKKGKRNHEQKKEWELKENVDFFESTQGELQYNIARALGQSWFRGDMRKLLRSPYVYGADIQSTAVVKKKYMDNFKGTPTKFTMAAFDTEKDVVHGTDEINMATTSFGSKVITVINKKFFEGRINVIENLQNMAKKYLGEVFEERKIDWEIVLVDSDVDIIKKNFERVHEWKPDFVAIWNIDFDVPLMVKSLEAKGVNPADVFSDPSIPPGQRFFRYKQGTKKKITASGKVMPIKPAAQWHTVYTPASYYFIDSMCAYKSIRTGSQELQSYSLDFVLNTVFDGKVRKLKIEEGKHLTGLEWHQFMQQHHPFEYVVYNVFDCISMEILDEKTLDLQMTLPAMSAHSDFDRFNSQPRRRVDDLHYFVQEHGYVIGTTCDEMAVDADKYQLGLEGWIITLPAHLVADNGIRCLKENDKQATNIRVHVADLDVSASYPNGGAVFNISKETTEKEMYKIRGVDEYTQRMQSINLSGGQTNALEFSHYMLGLPKLDDMLDGFKRSMAA